MSPKEKVNQLEKTLWEICGSDWKEIALIMIKENLYIISGLKDSVWAQNMKSFYNEVKKEIENEH